MKDQARGTSRRDVLKLSAASLPVAAAAVVGATGEAEAAAPEPEGTRLKRTAHVAKYFETARF